MVADRDFGRTVLLAIVVGAIVAIAVGLATAPSLLGRGLWVIPLVAGAGAAAGVIAVTTLLWLRD